MRVEQFPERHLSLSLTADDLIERELHTPSGKLSASALGDPLQWQILKSLAVAKRDVDAYTLRKFLRGKHVEAWYISLLPGVLETQKFVEYRNVVGYLDAFIDTSKWDWPVGEAPFEVKSVSAAKFKRIKNQGGPDPSHALQGALYGLAKGSSHFLVSYVCSDDYRTLSYTLSTADFKDAVDAIIDRYNRQKELGTIPVFEATQAWHKNQKYNAYYDWMNLTQEEIDERAEALGIYK